MERFYTYLGILNPGRVFCLLAAIAFLAGCFAFSGKAVAQSNSPSWNASHPNATPKPTRKPPVVHPTPVHRPAALLSVQYRIFKINDDGSQVDVSPLTVFHRGDHLRIAMRADQNVYLYVIRQATPSSDGQLFFPDSRINNGQNLLTKSAEIVAPSKCDAGTPSELCSYTVDGEVGNEVFTMIFTKNPSVSLLETNSGNVNGGITADVLRDYANSVNERLTTGINQKTHYIQVTNSSAKSSDKIVVSVPLHKGG